MTAIIKPFLILNVAVTNVKRNKDDQRQNDSLFVAEMFWLTERDLLFR